MAKTATTNLPESIRSARAILEGRLPLPGSKASIDRKALTEEQWVFNVFEPDQEVEDLGRPHSRTGLSRKTSRVLSQAEEAALQSDTPPVDLALRFYEAATEEALAVLMELSRENPYQSARLQSRFCVAVRAELAALVDEWEALA